MVNGGAGGISVGVGDGVKASVGVNVIVGVNDGVRVKVGEGTAVNVGVSVGVSVGSGVGVSVGVSVAVAGSSVGFSSGVGKPDSMAMMICAWAIRSSAAASLIFLPRCAW